MAPTMIPTMQRRIAVSCSLDRNQIASGRPTMTDAAREMSNAIKATGNTGIMTRSGESTSRVAAKKAGANAPAITPRTKGRECCTCFIRSSPPLVTGDNLVTGTSHKSCRQTSPCIYPMYSRQRHCQPHSLRTQTNGSSQSFDG